VSSSPTAARLIVLGGLPAVGKSTIARGVAQALGAVNLRIDTIEQALRASRVVSGDLGPAGYEIAYGIAFDNLKVGQSVVADSVNPISLTRASWRQTARLAGAGFVEIEVVCSDPDEHRQRVESREPDIDGLMLPTWQEVEERAYEIWADADIVIDTAGRSNDECITELVESLRADAI